MEIILIIILILAFSRLTGEIFERKKMPAIIGEVMVGILLGPMVLNWISPEMAGLKTLVDIGLFFLVFCAGLEFSLAHIRKSSRRALPTSFMGNNIAFFAGLFMAIMLNYPPEVGIFIGASFSLTALPVALRVLSDLGKENTRFGRIVVTSAVYDDLFSMFLLGIVFSVSIHGTSLSHQMFFDIVLRILLFLGIVYLLSRLFLWRYGYIARYVQHYIRKFRSKESEFAVIILFGMALALLAEFLSISFIIGAFYGGALIGERLVGENVYKKVKSTFSAVTYGFFAPIFFAYTGINFYINPSGDLSFVIFISSVFILMAVIGKTAGAYIGARLSNIPHKSSLGLGIALNSRGLMGLIIATYGLELGIIDQTLFSYLAIVSISTTLISPIVLSRYLKKYGSGVDKLKI